MHGSTSASEARCLSFCFFHSFIHSFFACLLACFGFGFSQLATATHTLPSPSLSVYARASPPISSAASLPLSLSFWPRTSPGEVKKKAQRENRDTQLFGSLLFFSLSLLSLSSPLWSRLWPGARGANTSLAVVGRSFVRPASHHTRPRHLVPASQPASYPSIHPSIHAGLQPNPGRLVYPWVGLVCRAAPHPGALGLFGFIH